MVSNNLLLLATASHDQTIKLWNPQDKRMIRTLQHPKSQVNRMIFSPDRKFLIAAGFEKIRFYDLSTSNSQSDMDFEGVKKNVTGVVMESDSKWFASTGEDGFARIWDTRERSHSGTQSISLDCELNCLDLYPNQVSLVIGDQSSNVSLWDLRNNKTEILHTVAKDYVVVPGGHSITSVAFDYAGTMLLAGDNEGRCMLWKLNDTSAYEKSVTFEAMEQFQAHTMCITKVLPSPDSTLIVTCSGDGSVKVWRSADLSLLFTLSESSQKWVWDAAFSEDSQFLFTGSSDGRCRIWNLGSGTKIGEVVGHLKALTALALFDRLV